MTGEDLGGFGLFVFGDRRSIQLSYAHRAGDTLAAMCGRLKSNLLPLSQ